MSYQRKDSWYRRAKREGYRSRAAYKLLELDRRLGLFRRGQKVVDLGCAPGGWSQVAAEKVGPGGLVVGLDRLPCRPIGEGVRLLIAEVTYPASLAMLRQALGGPADLVLSDMAPDTSGVAFADHARSVALVDTAACLAAELLGPRGVLVAKVFDGPEVTALVERLQKTFSDVRRLHLKTTRHGSRELYLVARRSA